MARRPWGLVVAVAVVGVAVGLAVGVGAVPFPAEETHDHARVTVLDGNGSVVLDVEARVADTPFERYRGLSGTDSLPAGEGMLFVHDREREYTYVMRGMNYGLDIVFVDATRRVTAVEQAPPPGPDEDGIDVRRSGRAKWVLEVPRGAAVDRGVGPGDRVVIEYLD